MSSLPPAPRKILFVEDEVDLCEAYRRYFRTGFNLAFAASGTEALEQVRSFGPHVVVLDMGLPDTDGIEVMHLIRVTHPKLPVVITTAYSSMQPLVDVLGMGHSGYLVKPFDLSDLEAAIDAAV